MDLFTLSASLGLDITNFEGGIDSARRLLLQFAGVVVDFGKDVIETGMGFDKQMSAVQAVMGLTENTAENLATMNKLREFALEQARDSIFTSEEAATAYYYMGMAGWRAEQMISGLPGVMALAAASGEDLKMTSDMVTDSLTAFGYGADQATHFADVLAVTATNANTDVARMQQTFKNLAPIAGALGYSIEDVALSVGLIANSGVKGSQAGTALRNIFTRIATNAGATSNTLGALSIITDKLGVSFYDAEGKARDWGDVLTEVRAAWAGMDEETREGVIRDFDSTVKSSEEAKMALKEFATDVEKARNIQSQLAEQKYGDVWERYANQIGEIGKQYDDLLTKLDIPIPKQPEEYADALEQARIKLGLMSDQEQIYYGKQIGSLRGISGWLALMTASTEDVEQLTEAIENADGAAQAMADTRLDNLWGDIIHFNSVLDTLKISMYDVVKGPMREIVQYGSDALERITKAINEGGLNAGLEQLGTEIEAAGEKFAPMLEALGTAIGPFIDSLFVYVLPRIVEVGEQLAAGLLKGLGEGLASGTNDNPILGAIGVALGSSGYGLDWFRDLSDKLGFFSPRNTNTETPDWLKEPEMRETKPITFGIEFDPTMMNYSLGGLEDSIADAGATGGAQAANSVKSQIEGQSYMIDVVANISGFFGGLFRGLFNQNASAMSPGRIYRRPTIFGYADGAYQVAGDAGPEAVVGVHSLRTQIREAVASGILAMAQRPEQDSTTDRRMAVYLDSNKLVGYITPALNRSLGGLSAWQGGDHA